MSDPVSSSEEEQDMEAAIQRGLWALFLVGMLAGGLLAWGLDQWLTP